MANGIVSPTRARGGWIRNRIAVTLDVFLDEPRKFQWMLYGALIMATLVGVFALAIAQTGRVLTPPLLKIVPQRIELPDAVCAGDEIIQDVVLMSSRPSVVDLDISIYDVQAQKVVLGTERSISNPVPERWNEVPLPVRFKTPDVGAGQYLYVAAITPRGRSYEVAFLEISFEIGACE